MYIFASIRKAGNIIRHFIFRRAYLHARVLSNVKHCVNHRPSDRVRGCGRTTQFDQTNKIPHNSKKFPQFWSILISDVFSIMWFQKISRPPPRRELEIPEGRGGWTIKSLSEGKYHFIFDLSSNIASYRTGRSFLRHK